MDHHHHAMPHTKKYDKTGTSTDDNPIKEPEMIKQELLSTKNCIITSSTRATQKPRTVRS